ncbi:hypothetical protein BDY24DRAFT_23314 [Mrakia frigida]|uniref:uncharacterized protein n=1 Tax=Mrakia frigida TaxID=29902 RepID=UPI003FCC14D0
MLRPMSYASEIGFDPEAGEIQVEVYENGAESDDWMYSSEKEMDEVMKVSTAYGNGPFYIFMRVGNLFCLIFLILLLLLLFIGYPILDRFVLHGFSGGGRYAPNPVARPLGTYGPESSSSASLDGAVVETLAAATTTAAATITGGLFGRRVST